MFRSYQKFCIDKDTCVPRLPSYLLKKKTANRPIKMLNFEDMPDQDLSRYGLVGSPTSVERMFASPESEKQLYFRRQCREKSRKTFFYWYGQPDFFGQKWVTVTTVRNHFHRSHCTAWEG